MRLLIIANSAMNESSSNGRTLKNLLCEFVPDDLAQFYINGVPDISCCANYYHIPDKVAVKALLDPVFRKNICGKVVADTSTNYANGEGQVSKKIVKSCKNKFIRDLIWSTKRWWTKDFDHFLDVFSPEAVLLYAGDTPFMFDIARLISKKREIPLVMYNCENYVLKDILYAGVKKHSFWHILLKNRLKKAYYRFMNDVRFCFYNTEYLEDNYQLIYPHKGKSCSVYTAANMRDCRTEQKEQNVFTLLYCGNLGVGRASSLVSLANVLYSVNPMARLKIFGSVADSENEKLLSNCSNVIFGGRITYEQVLEETKRCSMVVHCENPDRLVNLQCAFSTKISDYLSCGVPILIYALRDFPFVKYLEKHNVAHIAENENELKCVLTECVNSKNFREKYVNNAVALANKNHNLKNNGNLVKDILNSVK